MLASLACAPGGWLAVIGRAASPSEKTARASIVPQVRDEVKSRGKNKSLNPADKGLPCRCASLALLYKATRRSQKRGEERNGIFLRPILVLRGDAARMALGDASWYAAPLDHHSGSTGGEYPASSRPQPMVDNPRVYAAGKSDRLMGVCVHPMAQPHLGRWPASVSSAVCSRAGGPRARNPARPRMVSQVRAKNKPHRLRCRGPSVAACARYAPRPRRGPRC